MKQLSPFVSLSASVCLLPFLFLTASSETSQPSAKSGRALVYIGTYTGPKSNGIYLYQLDLGNGSLTSLGLAAEAINPSFLAIHPNHRFLYAVSETSNFGGKKGGAVEAFAIQETGKLTPLNQEPSGGAGPCYLVVDKTGKDVLVANYDSGSVSVLPIQPDGKLGAATAFVQHQGSSADPQRQEGPHAHSINVDAANRFAFAADLGLDKVLVYRFDPAKGTLVANDPPSVSVKPGAGPRHFAFHPGGHYALSLTEMQSTVTAASCDPAHGVLKNFKQFPLFLKTSKEEQHRRYRSILQASSSTGQTVGMTASPSLPSMQTREH
jgi:6-phosphogluconolactonase